MPEPVQLYHFTCAHGFREIGHSGVCLLLPHFHPWLSKKLVWLTEQPSPHRHDVGLTSTYIRCDRMQHRYLVQAARDIRPWLGSAERDSLGSLDLHAFEFDEAGRPAATHAWWISDQAVRARYDRSWILEGRV